ncbi:uncharacterized protein L3040_005929 [Drepanopeziza brunnea f. sp. 'multigermtubi']|nr:hypothetical protein L3040_005929 [Drepanopeziza brunnea f. sp. 'multigermtubi']
MTINSSSTASEHIPPPDVPLSKPAATEDSSPPPKVPAAQAYLYGLQPSWPVAKDLAGSDLPCRVEGELSDLVVYGSVPKEIDGTFYRVMCDPFVPPVEGNVPLDGDGTISAFRFHNGTVDMKLRYIETERYKLERNAKKALFGLYRNPFTHHPCVRAAVDSTANTNLVFWANKLLGLKEGGLPYACDPHTLDTLSYDPFGDQVKSKTFTAHPKIDPFNEELVVFGYEAKGLATTDIVSYTLDKNGVKTEELWLHSPWVAAIHDCVITENWLVLVLWPFETNMERLKAKKQHWAWNYNLPVTFIVIPRRKSTPLPPGWQPGETRYYQWKNCMAIHTGCAWEDAATGKIYLETSRVHDNAFPFFPPDDGRMPSPDSKADYVRWELDPSAATGSSIPDPLVILDFPSEFPRMDERFMTKKSNIFFIDAFLPDRSDSGKNIYQGLNSLAMHDHRTGSTRFFYAGDSSNVQEPVFVPRSETAEEGDGWVIAMVQRPLERCCDLVVIDTREFEKPVAIVRCPVPLKVQIHGNWVDGKDLAKVEGAENFVRQFEAVKISGRGSLEPL